MKFFDKLFSCKHPLDKVRLIKVGTVPHDHSAINQTTTEDYMCLSCYEMITRTYKTFDSESGYVVPDGFKVADPKVFVDGKEMKPLPPFKKKQL